jgi:two-component system sensor histidine kinase PilS (NtrC family)
MEDHAIGVDAPGHPIWCLADEAQVRQIVWNLATNGLRAMPDGGKLTLGVSERVEADGSGYVTIAVSDEGIGIDAQHLDGILQPFHGAFSRGTGLGLSIVHRIVSDYGGELQVTSQQGQGTTVTVKLPQAQSAAAATADRATVT